MAGHTLTLGAGSQKPAYSADPSHGLGPFGGAGFFLLKGCINSSLPYTGGSNNLRAFSVAFYLKLTTTPPGTESYIYRFIGGSNPSAIAFRAMLTAAGQIKVYQQFSGGDDINLSDTALASGDECHVVATRAASHVEGSGKVRLYINGVLEDEVARAGASIAANAQPSFYWGTDNLGFTPNTGAPVIIGRTLVYDGELSAQQVRDIYTRYRLAYPNLVPLP